MDIKYKIDVVENVTNVSNINPETPFEKVVADCMKDYLEYRKLEEQGLLLRLPCKVGDTVWGLVNFCNDCYKFNDYCHRGCKEPKLRLKKFKVDHFEIHNDYLKVCAISPYEGDCIWGETVFLTKQEAEQVLDELNNKTDL